MPDTPEYLAEINKSAEGSNFLDAQSKTADEIVELIEGSDETRLRTRPTPNKWSVTEIVAHLAEDEISSAWRYRQMIENPGVLLSGFDQDVWAGIGAYAETSIKEWLNLFRCLRNANLRMLKRLTSKQWEAHGIHAERGRITVRELARHMAGHDAHHLAQIRKMLGKP